MLLTKEFAEILGMFAADGCLQEKYICMWGNLFADKEYYDSLVCPLFSKVFEKKVVPHEKKSNSVYGFYICDKEIVRIFREIGFTRNKTYDVSVPIEILNNQDPEIIASFIRGYADCDGCISFMKRKGKYIEFKCKFNTYPIIHIVSVSKQVIKEMSTLLTRLNILHTVVKKRSKNEREKEQSAIVVRGPTRVGEFIKKIGFNNPAQQTKYNIWLKFGMCPPRITMDDRKKILEGKINPFEYY